MGRSVKKPSEVAGGDINQVVADNLIAILGEFTPERWQKAAPVYYVSGPKKGKKVSPRKLRDIINCVNSPSLDVIAAIAEAEQLQPYQLLFPRLNPRDAPVLLSKEQQQIVESIRQSAHLLK